MENRPITPLLHGILDYGLVATLIAIPRLLNLGRKNVKLYTMAGVNLGIYNALTKHGADIKGLIPFKTHYKVDYGNLAGFALLSLKKSIRKDKAALIFNTVFLALAAATVLLTDPDAPIGEISK